jgi:hypothetical protein
VRCRTHPQHACVEIRSRNGGGGRRHARIGPRAPLVQTFPADDAVGTIATWIEGASGDEPRIARRAKLALDAVAKRDDVAHVLVGLLHERHASLLDDVHPDARALRKKIDAIEKKREKKP